MARRRSSIRPPQPIGHTLRQLARWAIAGSLGAAAGCGSDFDGWTAIDCADRENLLRNASFARDRDYFGIWRDINAIGVPSDIRAIQVSELGKSGKPCSSASDVDACMSEYAAATMVREACRQTEQCGVFAVVTEGDRVEQLEDRAQLLSWLAPIDNLSDALTLSTWDDKHIQCPRPGEPGTRYERDGDRFLFGTEWENCGIQVQRDTWEVSDEGRTTKTETEKLGESNCSIGRRPEGLCPVERRFARGTLAAHFAEIAHLEAASVYAFERLARELTRFDAPKQLITSAASSALDEIHHAQLMSAAAKRCGAEPYRVSISDLPTRSLYQLALENAVEGCIHETYGALIAHHQAAHAQGPELRSAMRLIARDETRHAELAWHIAAWVTPQLSAAQHTEIQQAQALALVELAQSQRRPTLPREAAMAIGLPSPAIAQALVRELTHLASRTC